MTENEVEIKNETIVKKSRFGFVKKTWFKILAAILIIIGIYIAYNSIFGKKGPQYVTISPTKEAIIEEVSETGRVVSPEAIDLYFQNSGRVKEVLVSEGDMVLVGQPIIRLDTTNLSIQEREAAATLASAQAKYNQAMAGLSAEDLRIYQTAVSNAELNLAKARESATESVAAAQSDVEAAETSYNNAVTTLSNTRASAVTTLSNLYESSKTTMRSGIVTMSTAMTDIDNILGIDNSFANDTFEVFLGVTNPQTKTDAENAYRDAKIAVTQVTDLVGNLSSTTPQSSVDGVITVEKNALNKTIFALEKVKLLLNTSTTSSTFSLTDLNTKKATIDTDRTSVTTALANLENAEQGISAAKNTNETNIHTAETAKDSAERSLASARARFSSAEASANVAIASAEGSLRTAQDQLSAKQAPLRDVDRAVYLSAVSSAQAGLDLIRDQISQATLKAPIDGTVGNLDLKVGELATSLTRAASMISNQLQIDVDVSELDINKISVGSVIEATFDALGSEIYQGKVLMVATEEKVKDEDIFYKVTASLDSKDVPIRSGMTADVSIKVAEKSDALVIPSRLLIKRSGKRFVRVLKNNVAEEVEIQTGLESDDKIEVVSGLSESDLLITDTK